MYLISLEQVDILLQADHHLLYFGMKTSDRKILPGAFVPDSTCIGLSDSHRNDRNRRRRSSLTFRSSYP